METVFDPLRRKAVARTPEEDVRQWFINILKDTVKVPVHMMMSEVGFSWGGKKYRADILVYDRAGKAFMVVECKRPDVELDRNVAEQALRYNSVLDVKWIFLTNGTKTLVYKREGENFKPSGTIPDWETAMLP